MYNAHRQEKTWHGQLVAGKSIFLQNTTAFAAETAALTDAVRVFQRLFRCALVPDALNAENATPFQMNRTMLLPTVHIHDNDLQWK